MLLSHPLREYGLVSASHVFEIRWAWSLVAEFWLSIVPVFIHIVRLLGVTTAHSCPLQVRQNRPALWKYCVTAHPTQLQLSTSAFEYSLVQSHLPCSKLREFLLRPSLLSQLTGRLPQHVLAWMTCAGRILLLAKANTKWLDPNNQPACSLIV